MLAGLAGGTVYGTSTAPSPRSFLPRVHSHAGGPCCPTPAHLDVRKRTPLAAT